VVDFAHTPDALEHALIALRAHSDGRLWCVFGCGGDRDKGKRSLMGRVAERYADQVVLTDDNPRTENSSQIIQDILSGIKDSSCVSVEQNRAKAIACAIQNAQEGDVVLIAGKGHEEYQLIGDQKVPFSDRDEVHQWLGSEIS
jgi:UDP-N-acetylmuramoyl-L-alanyl-D-glutamate--2,6-diaminopimelate ligase